MAAFFVTSYWNKLNAYWICIFVCYNHKDITTRKYYKKILQCPVRALRYYLDKTKDLRSGKQLVFVSFKKNFNKDIAPATISSWIKQTILLCYQLSNEDAQQLHQVRAHDVRAFAASKAFQGGVSLDQILWWLRKQQGKKGGGGGNQLWFRVWEESLAHGPEAQSSDKSPFLSLAALHPMGSYSASVH